MDINDVSQSISTNNDLVAKSVTAQTEVNNKLMNHSVAQKTTEPGGTQLQEEGKGLFIDTLA